MEEKDYYSLLGVPWDATVEEIRSAYFTAARKYHPDAHSDRSDEEKFILIQEAYEIISNTARRALYDQTLPADLKYTPEILLTAHYSRNVLPLISEPQLAYVLFQLTCTANLDIENLPPIFVCLAIDRSTSMQGARMDMVKASVNKLLTQLRPTDMIAIVTFSDRSETILPPMRLKEASQFIDRISMIRPGGGTEMFYGLQSGVEQLRNHPNPRWVRHLIILTDGKTYGDEDTCLALAREAAEEGISISALGIGEEWNDHFLDKLTSYGGGSSHFITSPEDLNKFFQLKLSQLGSTYARQLTLDFQCDPGIKINYAFRLYPDTNLLQENSPIPLGDLQFQKSIQVLLEFQLPPLKESVEPIILAAGQIRMEIPHQHSQKARLFFRMSRHVAEVDDYEPPPENIVDAMSKLTLYRIQENARLAANAGDILRATRHLHHLANNLLNQGKRELAQIVLNEAETVQNKKQFSQDGEKRIKYGTRALMLPQNINENAEGRIL